MSRFWLEPEPLVLASKSAIRRTILRDAAIPVEAAPSTVDERAVEQGLIGEAASPAGVARALAEAKALDVSLRHPGRLVVGCDQTLALGSERFTKPADKAAGRAQLMRLSGATHTLSSGVAIARDGATLWSGVEEARLTMRPLTDAFLDAYLEEAGDGMLTSVGGYQFEGAGAHLFDRVEGDFRTVLGLPLLPLLAALRGLKAVIA